MSVYTTIGPLVNVYNSRSLKHCKSTCLKDHVDIYGQCHAHKLCLPCVGPLLIQHGLGGQVHPGAVKVTQGHTALVPQDTEI